MDPVDAKHPVDERSDAQRRNDNQPYPANRGPTVPLEQHRMADREKLQHRRSNGEDG